MHISNYYLYVGLIFLAAFDTTYFTGIFLIIILCWSHSNYNLYVGLIFLAVFDTTYFT